MSCIYFIILEYIMHTCALIVQAARSSLYASIIIESYDFLGGILFCLFLSIYFISLMKSRNYVQCYHAMPILQGRWMIFSFFNCLRPFCFLLI